MVRVVVRSMVVVAFEVAWEPVLVALQGLTWHLFSIHPATVSWPLRPFHVVLLVEAYWELGGLAEAGLEVAILEGAMEDSKEDIAHFSAQMLRFGGRFAETHRLSLFPLAQQQMLSRRETLYVDFFGRPVFLALAKEAQTSDGS